MSEIKLKPCPFCGCHPELNMGLSGAEIRCPHCGIGTGYIRDEGDYMEFTRMTEFGEEGYIRHKRSNGIEVAIEIRILIITNARFAGNIFGQQII